MGEGRKKEGGRVDGKGNGEVWKRGRERLNREMGRRNDEKTDGRERKR